MTDVNCGCRRSCILFAVVASVVVGIITAILTVTATITVTPAFYWVALGIAVLFLAVVFAVLLRNTNAGRGCLCAAVTALLVGILGTVLAALILLGVGFVATSILGAIITGALLAFFSLIITTVACIIRCLANCSNN